jgi:excisionase family DNA binding protein
MEKQVLTTREAADYIGIKEETLRRWVAAQRVPFVRLNRLLRFRRSALDKWLAEQEQEAQ